MTPTTPLTSRIAPALLLAATMGVGGVAAAQPAAAVSGVVTPQVTSVINSTAQKAVRVDCPTGTRALGGSAVVGGSTRIGINSLFPDQTGYTVLAREQNGGTGNSWYVVVTALCAPASALPGLEYVRTDSPYDSTASHRAIAACSPGKKLVGVGGLIDSNGSGQDALALTAVRPTADLTSVTAAANETPIGYAGSWRATAVAVCANPIPGLAWADTNTAIDSTSTKRAPAACPTGTRVLSGGFDIGSAAGNAELTTAFLDPDLTGDPTHQGYEAQAAESGTGFTGSWRTASYAICAA